jgi:hypothetical protein
MTESSGLNQEELSVGFILECKTNLYEQVHHLPLHSFLILQHCQNGFKDIIGDFLELSFARQFSQTSKYPILFVLNQLHNVLILSIKQYLMPQLHKPTQCLDSLINSEVIKWLHWIYDFT